EQPGAQWRAHAEEAIVDAAVPAGIGVDERVMSCAENSEIGECIGAAALQPDDVMGFQVGGRGADAAPWLTAQGLIGVARVAKAGSRVVGCLLRLGHGPVSSHADITISRCRYHNRLPGE